ncbi:MAG TPA: tripartite tricarboxylate transporter substrate binding protein [Microvirga sp.]|jgi:putative tricarboxylic transport membrane protein|nr:tripartite tricarboxylate transporter substrate binding protein [Microvirga sp.]
MSISRRDFAIGASLLPLAAASRPAFAQSEWKPTKEVDFVIPFAVGGGADLLARIIHKIMIDEKLVPTPVVLNNRPGGGGAAGIGYMSASRRADPHTIVLVNGTTQITPILNPAAKTLSEIRPVANVMLDDFLLFVRGDAPWKTAPEFVANAKSKPPKSVAFATGGTTDVMAIAVLSKATGVEYNVINFNSGGEALTQLLGGHVQACLGNPLEFMGHLESKAVRALGVFRDTRFEVLPDVPTMKEQGIVTPPFQMWRGVAMPKGAPDEAAKYWEGIVAKVVATPAFKKYLKDNAAAEALIQGDAFAKFIADQERLYRDLLGKPA